jgi:hypothetical protein
MLLRLATFGALGYAAYNYYSKNREQVDGALRRLVPASGGEEGATAGGGEGVELAGGPLSGDAQVVHAGEGPLA